MDAAAPGGSTVAAAVTFNVEVVVRGCFVGDSLLSQLSSRIFFLFSDRPTVLSGVLAYLGLGLFDLLDPAVIVSPRSVRHVSAHSSYLLSVDILRRFPPMLEVMFRLQLQVI